MASGCVPTSTIRTGTWRRSSVRHRAGHRLHRLRRHRAGRPLDYAKFTPDTLADAIATEIGRETAYRPLAFGDLDRVTHTHGRSQRARLASRFAGRPGPCPGSVLTRAAELFRVYDAGPGGRRRRRILTQHHPSRHKASGNRLGPFVVQRPTRASSPGVARHRGAPVTTLADPSPGLRHREVRIGAQTIGGTRLPVLAGPRSGSDVVHVSLRRHHGAASAHEQLERVRDLTVAPLLVEPFSADDLPAIRHYADGVVVGGAWMQDFRLVAAVG